MIGVKEEFNQNITDITIDDITVKIVDNVPRWNYNNIEKFMTAIFKLWDKDRKPLSFETSSFNKKFGNYGNKDVPIKDTVRIITDITEAMGFLPTVISDTNNIYITF